MRTFGRQPEERAEKGRKSSSFCIKTENSALFIHFRQVLKGPTEPISSFLLEKTAICHFTDVNIFYHLRTAYRTNNIRAAALRTRSFLCGSDNKDLTSHEQKWIMPFSFVQLLQSSQKKRMHMSDVLIIRQSLHTYQCICSMSNFFYPLNLLTESSFKTGTMLTAKKI